MNDAVREIYRLILRDRWKMVDQRQEGAVRIVMLSSRIKPKVPKPGLISRAGKKLQGTHNYPTKIFYFNTENGDAIALSMLSIQNMEHKEFLDKVMAGMQENKDDLIMVGTVLL